MNKIEVRILHPEAIFTGEQMMVFGARLTQRGHNIKNMDDLVELYRKPYSQNTVANMLDLPHANIKRFSQITVAVVGASRRFLAQITRHQDDCHFISASLQYSDYSGAADFVIPYNVFKMEAQGNTEIREMYLKAQATAMHKYEEAVKAGLNHDEAGYMMPHGLRNILLIAATPFQWMHMISQRVCNRNSLETQYVMLLIWEALAEQSKMFEETPLPDCGQPGGCREGLFRCGWPLACGNLKEYAAANDLSIPTAAIELHYPLIRKPEGERK